MIISIGSIYKRKCGEKMTEKSGKILTVFLILAIIIIIVMGFLAYKFHIEKTKETEKTEKKDYTDIILDGNYVISNSDAGWSFTKDGKAAFSGNTSINQGTYKTTGKNTIQIHYTKSKVWDDETGKEKISNIDSYEYITIDDDNNVYWTNPDGDKEKLERYGDVVKENFE